MIGLVVALATVIVVSTVAGAAHRHPRVRLTAGVAGMLALGAAAIAAGIAEPFDGAGSTVCLVLIMAVSAIGGTGLVPALFDVVDSPDRATPGQTAPERSHADRSHADRSHDGEPPIRTPLRGGRVIGVLERIAITATLLAGWPEGVAVVLAVKGLARYPEIRDQHAGEQFIIGTFGSVLWAVAAAGVGHLVVT